MVARIRGRVDAVSKPDNYDALATAAAASAAGMRKPIAVASAVTNGAGDPPDQSAIGDIIAD